MRPLLSALTRAAVRLETGRDTLPWRLSGVVAGLLLATGVLLAPTPAGLSPEGHRTAAVAVLMAFWWVLGVLPMAVTALVPLVAFPLLGVSTINAAAAPYAHPLNFLMLGGFVLGHAMEEVGLHRRLTAALLAPAWVRASPRRVLLALMVATAAFSGVVSNTATALMLLPLANLLGRSSTSDPRAASAFVLGLAYASSIGGVATLVGTPPNAVLAGVAADNGLRVDFATWLGIGVPFALLALPAAWLVVAATMRVPATSASPIEAPVRPAWTRAEALVFAVAAAALVAWTTRAPVDLGAVVLPGWSGLLPDADAVDDAFVAIAVAGALFLLPANDGGLLLDWRRVERAVPWGVLLLLGGGFALADAIKSSGLTAWAAGPATQLAGLPPLLTVAAIALLVTFVTELTSNTATTQIALPLLAAGAVTAGVDPLLWMVPATISASCAFMMPVATAPNAIASQAGGVRPGDMALAGLALNLVCVVIAVAVTWACV